MTGVAPSDQAPSDQAPSDQAVREAAMRDLDTSIFLRAGAGTGKTSVLVGRVVEAVRRGRAELREIVAITFTEKAAGDLRDRVRRELYEALRSADAVEAERLRRALQQVDGAHIETIHAFASSLLRERPLEAALDPNFTVLDAVGAQLTFEQAWQDWLWSEEEAEARPRIERCLRLGLPLETLRTLVSRMAETRDVNPQQTVTEPEAAASVHTALRAEAKSLRERAEDLGPTVVEQAQQVLERLEAMSGLPEAALEAELSTLVLPRARLGRRKGEARLRYEEVWERLEERLRRFAEGTRTAALAAFIEVAYQFVQRNAVERRRQGKLTFEDLLINARDLLAGEARVRGYFRERYKFLLIDEFQDTDPLQTEIVLLLAAQTRSIERGEITLTPGRLFVVGDPKQSIYRFRRADIDSYAELEEIFRRQEASEAKSARVDELEVNFRSRPEMVAWHNQVFQTLIQRTPDFPHAQPDYQPLTPHRRDEGFGVIHLLPNTGVDWRTIGEARADEARAIVRFIETVVGTDELSIAIPDADAPGGSRPPRYRDICLLVRNRTAIEIYTEALEAAAIPYHLDSGRSFFLQQETRDAAAILTALDDPSDEVAVVATLKSAPFAASDAELLAYARAGGRFRLSEEAIPREYQGPLREVLQSLLDLKERKGSMSLPAYVDYVLRATHMLEIQLARKSAQRAANLQMIVQRAADFAGNEVDSLRPFVRWLGTQTRTDLGEAEWPVTEVEEDVVRMLTIHQAKGLEFPIVVLTKVAAANAPDRSVAVVNRESATIDFQVGRAGQRFQTPGYGAAQARQKRYEASEERRLLYVAATRARDYLVVPAFYTDRVLGYHADLEEALPGWLNRDYEVDAPGAVNLRVEQLVQARRVSERPAAPDLPALRQDWAASREAGLAAGASQRRYVTPSRLGHDRSKEPRESEPRDRSIEEVDRSIASAQGGPLEGAEVADGPPVAGGAGDGRDLGTAIHDALQIAELHDVEASVWRARNLCIERGSESLADDVEQNLRTTLSSELFGRVRAAERIERELPLVRVDADEVIEGYVDLVFREAEGWVLVDYKSDREPSPQTIEGYEAQIRAYVEAFRGTGEPVTGAYLLFTGSGAARAVAVE